VPRSTLEYAQSDRVTGDYDAEFADSTLFHFDQLLLEQYFASPGLIVDLGCGTGRLVVAFARRGFPALAVDLSRKMLDIVGRKARAENLAINRLLANLVELDCLRDGVADYVICMFSTLGMIRGRDNRRRALAHAHRILKPGGVFVVHVHNRWSNLFLPQGRQWLWSNLMASLAGRDIEAGDKFFAYHDVPQMFLHLFTLRELKSDLRQAGFTIESIAPLNNQRREALRWPWLLGRLRANGWIVACHRDVQSRNLHKAERRFLDDSQLS
jgi:SAM-dependent methyltransferase